MSWRNVLVRRPKEIGLPTVDAKREPEAGRLPRHLACASGWYVSSRRLSSVVLITWVVMVASGVTVAHENHAPLPTKGVTIAGNTIMLSDKAREAIGLTTAKVVFGDIHRILAVNARVELPFHAQAMITSLVSGRID